MAEITAGQIFPFLFFLIFPLTGAIFSVKVLRSSPLLGYILGGAVLGELASHLFDKELLLQTSNIGIILLLFTIGLEVRFSYLKRFGKLLLKLGLAQIILTFLAFLFIFLILGFSFAHAVVFASSFSISSTAVVAKLLQDGGKEDSLVGGLTMGVLLLQDIALVPLLVVSSAVAQGNIFEALKIVLFEFLKIGGILFLAYYFSLFLASSIFDFFAKFPREVLNLFTVFFGVLMLYLLSLLHFSPLLAAFLTGVILAQTIEHQHIFSEIRPFRDFFAIIFFTVLGLSFPISAFLPLFLKSLGLAAFIAFLKISVILAIALFLRLHTATAFSLALNLFQVGEGAFVILQQAVEKGIVNNQIYLTSVGSTIILLLFTPFLFAREERIYNSLRLFLRKRFKKLYDFISLHFDRELARIDVLSLRNHIVICGYGRVGSYIGRALQLLKIPFIAVDYDFRVVEKAKRAGVNIVYGDPTNPDVLDYLEVDKASILIIAVPDRFSQETILTNALSLNPKLKVFTRVHREIDMHRLKELGADVIVHPEFEASLSIIRKILILQGLDKENIKHKLQRLKIEHWLK